MARTTTNNGWAIIPEKLTQRIYVGADLDGASFRVGDTAVAFRWFFRQIDERVEPVLILNGSRTEQFNSSVGGDDGSNHLSGTAGDVNGGRHPYERKNPHGWKSGWTADQIEEIREILREAGGLFFWGLDYGIGWRDPMHFDIAKGKTEADVAAFLRKVYPPAPPKPKPPTPNPAPAPATTTEVLDMIIRRDSDGAAFLVSGGVGSRLVSGADMGAFKAAGLPQINVSDAQYAEAEARYLK